MMMEPDKWDCREMLCPPIAPSRLVGAFSDVDDDATETKDNADREQDSSNRHRHQ